MGKVKSWLMEMQDYAYFLIEVCDLLDAERKFLKKYPNQKKVFWNCFAEMENV